MNTFARALAAAALLVAVAVAIACGERDPSPSPSGEPTASPTPTVSPLVVRTPGPTGLPPQTDYRLIYREYTPQEDIIWATQPDDVGWRGLIVRIPHREGYASKPSISPDGTWIAYVTLPDFALSTDSSQADAYVIDLKKDDREPVKIAEGVDYNYTPFWSPDSKLVYLRSYAGPEFLAASVMIVRVAVTHDPGKSPTPTPTPSPQPGIEPVPAFPPIEIVQKDTVAHVLSFAPIGFADDKKSYFFIQEAGGTAASTLAGIYSPATSDGVNALHKQAIDAWYAAQNENKRLADEAAANGQPPPVDTVTPAPTSGPDARFVVQLSEQQAFDYAFSPDAHKISYISQRIDDTGEIHNAAYIADLVEASAKPLDVPGVASGEFIHPAWHPDGRITIGFLPSSGGSGLMVLMTLDATDLTYLPQPAAGFDTPRSWAPDGTWLVVDQRNGTSLAQPGEGKLVLVALSGQRSDVGSSQNPDAASVLGWLKKDDILYSKDE